jgi:hypothetical protein
MRVVAVGCVLLPAEGRRCVKRRPRIRGTSAARALFVLPQIADDDPPRRKNALAIRNACATEGKCPSCGAVGELRADPDLIRVFHFVFRHEAWCPVVADAA